MTQSARSSTPPQEVVLCDRCSTPLQVNPKRNPNARLLRHAETGVCANCAMTHFLKTMEPLATVIRAQGPDVLLLAPVQDQVARVLAAGDSDADASEIDWNVVVAQWPLRSGKAQ